jgi:class 3 adenylate cyclase
MGRETWLTIRGWMMANEFSRGPIKFVREEQRFLAAFGDIHGFRSWVRRCGAFQFRRSYALLQEQFVRFSTGSHMYKSLGDGFMAVWDLRPSHNCRLALDLVKLALDVDNEIELIRMGMPEPRFTDYRMRFVAGDAIKWTRRVGRRWEQDYVGQRINLCKELLYVSPNQPILLHESAWELFSEDQAQKEGFVLKPIPFKRYPELNMFDEDLRGLKRVERFEQ